MAKEITYEIKKDYGSFGTRGECEMKLTLISWNGGDEKFDIRPWNADGKAYKGITLTKKELVGLYKMIRDKNVLEDEAVEEAK